MQFYDKSILVALKDNVREPVHYMVARPAGKILSSNNNLLFLAFIEDFILQICCKLGIVLLVRVGPTCPKHCHATSTNNRTSHQLLITQIKHSLKYVNCSFFMERNHFTECFIYVFTNLGTGHTTSCEHISFDNYLFHYLLWLVLFPLSHRGNSILQGFRPCPKI